MTVKCGRNMIANDCEDHNCEQCQTGDRLEYWSDGRNSWWIIKCKETNVVTTSELLIIKCTAEKRGMFYAHSSVMDSDVEFVYQICLNHEFGELESHQWPDLIEEALNEGCFKGFIIKVVMLDGNAQELSIVFLKTVIFLLASL